MKFDLRSTLIEPKGDLEKRVIIVRWSPDGERLAIVTAENCVHLYNVAANDISRIPVKPKDENNKRNFTLTGFDWAPDSSRFVIAQTDQAVSVYDIGPAAAQGYQKKITMKITAKAAPVCCCWPRASQNDFVYGLVDGTVIIGLAKLKKTDELYRHNSCPVSIVSAMRQNAVLVGHMDGQVFMANLDNRSRLIALQVSVPPVALAWGSQVLAAGSDLQINFADPNGKSLSHIDFSNQKELRSFTASTFDPSGTTAIVAGRNTLMTFNYSQNRQNWTQVSNIEFEGLYHVTDISWSSDGSRIAVGSVTGGVYIVTASMGSFRYKKLFEVVNVTGSQLKVIDLQTGKELNLRSEHRILTTNFQQDRYVVVRTTQSFLVGDTKSGKTSEMPTSLSDGDPSISERFVFIDDLAVLVWNTGELTVVEFGKANPLAAIPTQYASSYLLSLRFGAKVGRNNSKILSYLVDSKTVRIIDVETQSTIGTVQIQNKIDWLELNVSGTMLLFRDSKRSLYLYNVVTKELNGLLNLCSYAQWVPEANVIVAQSKKSLYVYYSPTSPDEVKITEIEGDVVDIQRSGTKTTVTIQNAGALNNHPLDGTFIAFSASMEANNLRESAQILMSMGDNITARSLWDELAEASLRDHDYLTAELSYAKLGDLSRARFLHKLNKLVDQYGLNHCQVQARIAMLQSNFKQAEYCLIEHDQLDAAIDMYKSMHMWNELLDLAELRCQDKAPALREQYFNYLMTTGQYQAAAKLKAQRGQVSEAVDLCLQGNKPQLAAEILLNNDENANPQLLSHVAEALQKNNRDDIAGSVYEKLGDSQKALDCYCKGKSYYNALELAKTANPEMVIKIHKEWAQHLVSNNQFEAAIPHFVEANEYPEALNCALRALQWGLAADILKNISSSTDLRNDLRLQYLRVARHFASNNDVPTAEDLFLCVDAHKELIEMYLTNDLVDNAMRHAKRQLKAAETEKIFISTAKKLEKKPNTRRIAENIYLAIKKPNLAVEMYTQVGDSDSVLRLTGQYGGDKNQLEHMGAQAEKEGDLASAESFYIRAGQPEKALFMYRQEKKWQDAMRVAKNNCKPGTELSIAIHWAKDIGGSAGVQKLEALGCVEEALIYCCENSMTDFANTILDNSKNIKQSTIDDANYKFALAFESQSKFAEAEEHYIKANQAREAFDMYLHNKMLNDARRIGQKYGFQLPNSGNTATLSQSTAGVTGVKKGLTLEQAKDFDGAIDVYLSLSVQECGNEGRYDQVLERAVRLAANFCPNRLQNVVVQVAKKLLDQKRPASLGKILESIEAYQDAIDIYKDAGMWEEAKKLSGFLDLKDQEAFRLEYQQHLASTNDASKMINIGEIDQGLEMMAQKGDWIQCLEVAKSNGPQYVEKYTMKYAQELVDNKQFDEAISILAKYSPSSSSASIPSYIKLCQAIVYGVTNYENLDQTFYTLRTMMFKVLRGADENGQSYQSLMNITRAVHLLCQHVTLNKLNLTEMAARASVAVLRFGDVIPADWIYFKAGEQMEKRGNEEAALAFYNRFMDIIDNPDGSNIDQAPFERTDIPRNLCLRTKHSVDDSVVDKVKNWILDKTVSTSIEQQLPLAPCQRCGKSIYAASLTCPMCKHVYEFCHITGYPVFNPTKCTSCGVTANRSDWDQYISKTRKCPCCDSPQTAGA